jgi:ankyrin repeat protein
MQESARANALIHWGDNDRIRTHPLHYISDMLFEGALEKGKELPLVDALIEAGADVDFHLNEEKRETPLIGAASLGAEDVGLRLLTAGAAPHLRGMFGETALHWAALLGEDRLVGGLIAGADLTLKDERYNASPLGWAIHGWCNPPAGNHGRQREVVELLVAAGAGVKSEWLLSEKVRADPAMLAALRGGST